jgi:hypothetical protein
MANRAVAAEKHIRVAIAILDGYPLREALRRGGYSKSSCRVPGRIFKQSRPLREALKVETERRRACLTDRLPPRRQSRWNRRPTAAIVERYLGPDGFTSTNTPLQKQRDPKPHPLWQGKQMISCANCGRSVQEDKTFLNMSATARICGPCAGV